MNATDSNETPSGVTVRRVVTGVDASGRSVVNSDGPAPVVVENGPNGFRLIGLWSTDGTPPALSGEDLAGPPYVLEPPPGGCHWRLIVWQPAASAGHVHATDTVDLMYIISGEQILTVGEGDSAEQVHLRAGDCAILRATVHSWHNPGTVPCVALGTMLSAKQP
jgi:mannose-6-phosphate isomerase-like protein (cupin superfamily)